MEFEYDAETESSLEDQHLLDKNASMKALIASSAQPGSNVRWRHWHVALGLMLSGFLILAVSALRTRALSHGSNESQHVSNTIGLASFTNVTFVMSDVERICNRTLPVVPVLMPRQMNITGPWADTCHTVPYPDQPYVPDNRCWSWLKHKGCYMFRSQITWHEAQQRVSEMLISDRRDGSAHHVVPPPSEVVMDALQHSSVCGGGDFGSEHVRLGTEHERTAAKLWFDKNVFVYVINLKQDVKRWNVISERLDNLSISYERVWGVNFLEQDTLESAKIEGLIPKNYNVSVAREHYYENINGGSTQQLGLSGTMGCAAAHMRTLLRATRRDIAQQRPLTLVLEDDALLEEDFIVRLSRMLTSEVPCDWSLINLHNRCPYGVCVSRHLYRVQPDGNEPKERCFKGVNYGTQGLLYLTGDIKSIRQALMDTIWDQTRPLCLDIDVALASLSENISYYSVPSVQYPGLMWEATGFQSTRMFINQASKHSML